MGGNFGKQVDDQYTEKNKSNPSYTRPVKRLIPNHFSRDHGQCNPYPLPECVRNTK
jgi:hypothetical protein